MTIRANSAVILRDGQYAEALDEERGGTMRFVRVPDHLTAEEAQQALTEHVAWVPLPDGPTKEHVGKRVRFIAKDGPTLSGELASTSPDEFGRGISASFKGGWGGTTEDGAFYVHPDDVPADPDAELIEAMARQMADNRGATFDYLADDDRDDFLDMARAALAVVREHEATR